MWERESFACPAGHLMVASRFASVHRGTALHTRAHAGATSMNQASYAPHMPVLRRAPTLGRTGTESMGGRVTESKGREVTETPQSRVGLVQEFGISQCVSFGYRPGKVM